jgi:Ca2+-binding RTX toxin-like protein
MAVITGTNGWDYLTGTSGNDTISGLGGDDVIYGGSGGNDALYGGDGRDSIYSYGGTDTIDGGAGYDYWSGSYADSNSNFVFTQASPTSWTLSNGTKILNIESFTITTGSGNDTFNVGRFDGYSSINAGAGANTLNLDLSGASGSYGASVTYGSPWSGGQGSLSVSEPEGGQFYGSRLQTLNVVTGSQNDTFYLGGGDGFKFHVNGGGGNNSASINLTADTSNISFTLNTAANAISTFNGDGSSVENIQAVSIVTGAGNDSLTSASGDDTLDGGAGNNFLSSGAGNDWLYSHGGADTVNGGIGFDVWTGNYSDATSNIDFHSTAPGAWTGSNGTTLTNIETISLATGSGDDTLMGGNGADTLNGGTGNNALYGGAGDDLLYSYGGADTVDGGFGANTWIGDYSASTGNLAFVQTGDTAYSLSNGTTLANVQHVNLTTGSGDDTITMDVGGWNSIDGGAGVNTLNLDGSSYSGSEYLTFGPGYLYGVGGYYNNISVLNYTGGSGNDSFSLISDAHHHFHIDGGGGNNVANVDMGPSTADISFTLDTTPNTVSTFSSDGSSLENIRSVNLTTGSGDDTLTGGDGDDTLNGGSGNNALYGAGGDDVLFSYGGVDTIDGGSGHNSWDGNYWDTNSDLTFTQTGDDSFTLSNGTALSNIQSFQLSAGSGDNTFTLTHIGGYDGISAYGGSDTLNLDFGADTLDDNVHVYGGQVQVNSTGASLYAYGISTLNATTGSGDDFFWIGNQSGTQFHIDGGGGQNSAHIEFIVSGNVDFALDATPGATNTLGANTFKNIQTIDLTTGSGNDTLTGAAGDDTLAAGLGHNFLYGGAGDDQFTSRGGVDTVDGGTGVNSWFGDYSYYGSALTVNETAPGSYSLSDGTSLTNIQVFSLDGGSFGATFNLSTLSKGYASIYGGWNSSSTLNLNLSADTYNVTLSVNWTGSGSVTDSSGAALHYGNIQHLNLTAGSGDDVLSNAFQGGNVAFYGGAGDDTLQGGSGDDTLSGGSGDDTIDGGGGTDTFLLSGPKSHYTITPVGPGAYTVTDNVGTDGTDQISNIEKIQFSDGVLSLTGAIIGTSNDNILTGTANSETIYGLGGDDTLNGLGGNDVLYGGDGNDTLDGGSGDDTIDGGTGINTASYADAASAVTVSLLLEGSAQNTHGAGSDTVTNIQNLTGSNSGDVLIGDANGNVISGGSGDDTITGGSGDDTVDGGTGSDTFVLSGPKAHYTITPIAPGSFSVTDNVGSDGTDQITNVEKIQFSDGLVSLLGAIIGTSGNNLLTGTANADTIYGLGGDDTLSGVGGNDVLNGGDGNDSLDGGSGDDTIDGGTGTNTASYASAASAVTVSLLLESSAQNTHGGGTDTLSNIQNLTGSNFADTLIGDANANVLVGGTGDDTITGGSGDDTIDGGTGIDTLVLSGIKANYTITAVGAGAYTVTDNVGSDGTDHIVNVEKLHFSDVTYTLPITGWTGNDSLTGTTGDDVINGLGGNDVLNGLAGNDQLNGGDGDDTLDGGAGNDTIDGGTGTNTASYADAALGVTVSLALEGSPQNTKNAGLDTLTNIQNLLGSAHSDTLTGDGANNTLEGGAGDDTLVGGGGIDTASYASAAAGVTISLAISTAQATGGAGTDTLTGFSNLTGSSHADVLTGSSGNNVLIGGAGDDTLIGGLGTDTLTGGLGADRFAFKTLADSTVANPDTITDFSHAQGDHIALAAIDANTNVAGDQAFTLVASFTHVAGQLIEVAQSGGYLVEGDVNGDGNADFAIMVDTSTALVAADFVL